MKIVFISNFLNHHQKPIADYMYSQFGNNYHFVSCTPMPNQLKRFGYPDLEKEPYNILMFKDKKQYDQVITLVHEADVMIIGGTYQLALIEERLKTGKLIFLYSERWHKRRRSYCALPLRWLNGYNNHRFKRFNKENCYMLCSGAYVANDCQWAFAFKHKTYKWGYFPPFKNIDIENILKDKKDHKTIEVIWIARFLYWKHPELAIKSIHKLKQKKYNVHLTMIGGIDENSRSSKSIYNHCKEYIKANNLTESITILGNMPNEEVHKLLLKSDIFLFTSDRNEGWGAVLNEAMSNGCACIASSMIGATPFLIKDGENGLIFKDKSLKDLTEKLQSLLDSREKRESISQKAFETIKYQWNPITAAQNLIILCNNLRKNEECMIKEGPCSKAFPI